MAYLSDETGEFQLYLRDTDGNGWPRTYPLEGTGYYQQLTWSPDGKKMAYADQSWTLFWLDVTSGGITKVATDEYFDAGISLQFAWAPDSGWIACCKNDASRIQSLYLYSLETLASTQVTDGMAEISSPAFDAGDRFLHFLRSTNAGPTKGYMDMTAQDMQRADSLYLAVLQVDMPSPLARRNDQEPGAGGSAPGPPAPSTPLPTGGRVRIIGHEFMKRYFFPQAARQALIIDERFNRGGQYADYVLDLLTRPQSAHFALRWGAALPTPGAVISGHKIMLINEYAGSGGELLPWVFRRFGVGMLVGTRTWGGLVGILSYPPLMDGGHVTAPNLAAFDETGWIVENIGVTPDLTVEQLPADVAAGRDPQLEAALALALEGPAATPPTTVTGPPYPNKEP